MSDEIYRYRDNYFVMRYRLMMRTIMVMFITIIIMFIFIRISPILTHLSEMTEAKTQIMKAEAEGLKITPDLESTINDLEKRSKILTTESVDARLRKIETAIRIGEVRQEDLVTLQKLREDFEILKQYMFRNPDEIVAYKTLQKDYAELKILSDKLVKKDEMYREIDSLRNLFYVSLALFGTLVTIFAGSWFFSYRQKLKTEKDMSSTKKAKRESN